MIISEKMYKSHPPKQTNKQNETKDKTKQPTNTVNHLLLAASLFRDIPSPQLICIHWNLRFCPCCH